MKGRDQTLQQRSGRRLGFHGNLGGFNYIHGGRKVFGSRMKDVENENAKTEEKPIPVNPDNVPETDSENQDKQH